MQAGREARGASARPDARILVVADWTVDPHAVVAACSGQQEHDRSFILTVPAWLHGLDWAGDPTASAPCAQRQLEAIARLSIAAGLVVEVAGVGDPDPISAIGDALESHAPTEILLLTRMRRFEAPHPLDLVDRAQRATGLPVRRISLPAAVGPRRRRRWTLLRGGSHCESNERQAA
jgi:hypothetical protein